MLTRTMWVSATAINLMIFSAPTLAGEKPKVDEALKKKLQDLKSAVDSAKKAQQKADDDYAKARDAMTKARNAYRQAASKLRSFLVKNRLVKRPPQTKEDIAIDKARQAIGQAQKNWFTAVKALNEFRRKSGRATDEKTKKQLKPLEDAVKAAREAIGKASQDWHSAVRARNESLRKRTAPKQEKSKKKEIDG